MPSTKSSTRVRFFFSYKLCRVSLNNLFFRFFSRIFSSFSYSHCGKDTSPSLLFYAFFFVLFSFHTIAINHAQPAPSLISFSTFRLSLSHSLCLSRSLFLVHTLSLSSEYNSYVITGGRHPMSISPGMRDERFSPYHLDDLN